MTCSYQLPVKSVPSPYQLQAYRYGDKYGLDRGLDKPVMDKTIICFFGM